MTREKSNFLNENYFFNTEIVIEMCHLLTKYRMHLNEKSSNKLDEYQLLLVKILWANKTN